MTNLAIDYAIIEQLALDLATERDLLRGLAAEIEAEWNQILAARLKRLRAQVAAVRETEDQLRLAIEAAPALWQKPRTRTLHGIKCGLRTLPDKILFEDPEQTCRLIKKHLPDQAELLIRTKESPNTLACAELPVMDLKRIGGRLDAGAEQVVISDTLSDVRRLLDSLLSRIEEEA